MYWTIVLDVLDAWEDVIVETELWSLSLETNVSTDDETKFTDTSLLDGTNVVVDLLLEDVVVYSWTVTTLDWIGIPDDNTEFWVVVAPSGIVELW